ncbi:MAG: hypothetical protein LBH46_02070 [Rickettsiales bacterium]|jgi:hypothetical protein|nr:hypothetical protein [Rickettsiales bacterium]
MVSVVISHRNRSSLKEEEFEVNNMEMDIIFLENKKMMLQNSIDEDLIDEQIRKNFSLISENENIFYRE